MKSESTKQREYEELLYLQAKMYFNGKLSLYSGDLNTGNIQILKFSQSNILDTAMTSTKARKYTTTVQSDTGLVQ